MKVVLKQGSNYYAGSYKDKFDDNKPCMSCLLSDAIIYELSITNGTISISPAAPEGEWTMIAVKVEIV